MNLDQYLDSLRQNPAFLSCVTHWEVLPAQPARLMDMPAGLSEPIVRALHKRGIYQLYTHQRRAVDAALSGRSITVVTPTASGKTYCYNLPVLETILRDRNASTSFPQRPWPRTRTRRSTRSSRTWARRSRPSPTTGIRR